MELAVATAVLTIIGLAVVLFGLPFVDLIAKLRPARGQRAPSDMVQNHAMAVSAAFTPLKMGDSGQRWPSEVPRRKTSMDLLPWPSQTWADNPFPASTTSAPQQFVNASRQGTPAVAKPQRTAPHSEASKRNTERKRVASRPAPKRKTARKAPANKTRPVAPPQPVEPAPSPRPVAPPASAADAPEVSSQAILAIANDPSRGLASAVEYVREQTGWSFQRAAQHVAMALRNHT